MLTLDFSLPSARQTLPPTPEALMQFYDTVARDVSALPGVKSSDGRAPAVRNDSELGLWSIEIVGDPPVAPDDRPMADFAVADRATSGRWICRSSPAAASPIATRCTAPLVCIVNEAFVRRYLGGTESDRDAHRSAAGAADAAADKEIVGVARPDQRRAGAAEDLLQVYMPLRSSRPATSTWSPQAATGRRRR